MEINATEKPKASYRNITRPIERYSLILLSEQFAYEVSFKNFSTNLTKIATPIANKKISLQTHDEERIELN